MSSMMETLLGFAGGLALFIYGMNQMGDGLKKVAGEKMRKILEVLTTNPLMGVFVGTVATAIMQSSSATTVMVVGFVSAQLMTLPQAISVIIGANIGTTVTAQIIAFNIGDYAYLFAAVGFFLSFASKKRVVKNIGQTVFSFGVLFIGLNIMSAAMKPLASNPLFTNILVRIKSRPILGLLTGTVVTLIAQSSSATIGVLQGLASTPMEGGAALISLQQAIPILLGCNIGTTITAIFASIGATKNAKRTAVAHTVFNLSGSIVFMFIIPIFAVIVKKISPSGIEHMIVSRQIANAHTLFNILNTVIWIPLLGLLTKIVRLIIPGEDKMLVAKRTLYLDKNVLNNPAIAMELAAKELARMAEIALDAVKISREAYLNKDESLSEKTFELEEATDLIQVEVVNYLSTMLSMGTLNHKQSVRLAGLMHVAGDIERIGDYCENIAEAAIVRKNEKVAFSEEAEKEINQTFDLLTEMLSNTIAALRDDNMDMAKKVTDEEEQVNNIEAVLRERHMDRLNRGLCDPNAGISYIELVHNLEKIGDHCTNIAEAIIQYNLEGNLA